jgi:pimeloyl-ACP methyl ester carboxylesterase
MTDLHVTRWGQTGPRVVLVHGSAQGGRVGGDSHFARQQRLGSQGWQLLVPDRPGHGQSLDPRRPDDAQADGALVAELLGESAHVVGHSFGACVALAAAALRPSSVRSLTLIEPAMALLAMNKPSVLKFGLTAAMITMAPLSDIWRIKRFMQLVKIPPELRGTEGVDDDGLKRLGRAIARLRVPDKKTLLGQLKELRAAGVPLLVVAGSWSPAFRAISDSVAEVGSGKTLVISCEHHFPHLVSEQFNEALVTFMGACDQQRSV